jgi:heme/copper-type cytochrome/quinol oxidase subunit 1
VITTVFKQRTPGMTLSRLPVFVWASLIMSFMVIFAMPAVMAGSIFLAADRLIATHFFNPAEGGDSLLWQHLFWFFGHPEVYIIFIPATGMVSELVSTFARRRIFGYTAIILSLLSTAFIGFGLWVHHMFATSIPDLGKSFFTAASMMIAIPSGIQIFCWIATLWNGKVQFRPPLLFVIGFFFIFVLGGMSGIVLASVPIDLQVHDTFFVVAHFHYVLIGGAIFPLLGAIIYWFPKMSGRMMDEKLAKITFWITFVGFNITFFPMHQLGLKGMPRRVYTYLPGLGWSDLNLIATIGAGILGTGVLLFVLNAIKSMLVGERAGNNPWDAPTLEWFTTSPPPAYNFEYLPMVSGRTPLWTHRIEFPVVTGLKTAKRQVLITNFDAAPHHVYEHPGPTIWPFCSAIAIGITFIGLIFTTWALPIGALLTGLTLLAWFATGPEPEKIKNAPNEAAANA